MSILEALSSKSSKNGVVLFTGWCTKNIFIYLIDHAIINKDMKYKTQISGGFRLYATSY